MNNLLHSKYKPFLEALDKAASGSDAPIDTDLPSPSMPLPYMIVKTVGSEGTSLAIEASGLLLTASKLTCKYVKSRPTGASNDGVSVDFLIKNSTNKIAAATEAVAVTKVEPEHAASTETNYREPDQITDLKIDVNDPAIQDALAKMHTDDQYIWIFEMPEDGKENFPRFGLGPHFNFFRLLCCREDTSVGEFLQGGCIRSREAILQGIASRGLRSPSVRGTKVRAASSCSGG